MAMSKETLDQLRLPKKRQSMHGSTASTADHSMTAMEQWDSAHLREHDAHARVTEAREAYRDGLRKVNYSI
jgi:hypothetical protein